MEDVVDPFAGGLHASHILKVHLLKGDMMTDVGQIFEVSCREVVDAANLVSLLDEGMGQS